MNNRKTSQKYLTEFFLYSITTLHQIQNPTTKAILNQEEFKYKYKASQKLIKEALEQALFLFPLNPLQKPTATITTPKICAYHNQIDPTKGKRIQTIAYTKKYISER